MDGPSAKEPGTQPAQDGPAEGEPAPPSAIPSVDDVPQQHSITDELARLFLKNFLPADSQAVLKSYRYRPIASLGEGYTTVRKVLEVTYRDESSGKEDVLVMVVKVPSGNFVGVVREMGLYEREVIMYCQVIEHFRHILSQRGKQALLPFPRYVYGRMTVAGEVRDGRDQPLEDQTQTEMLVIELLQDFQVIDKKVGMGLEHLKLLMPALARFHSVGLVLRQRHSERADRLRQVVGKLPEGLDDLSAERSPCCAALEYMGLQKEADVLAKFCHVDYVKETYKNAFSEDLDVVTLVHGDLWSSNMMFRYETDADGTNHPVEVRFVDLQMCQFGDLAYDLVYCLISSSRRETRRDHLRQMLTWYEEAFRSQLLELGEDPEQVAPWLSVDWLIARYSNGLAQYISFALNVVQLLFSSDEDRNDLLGGTNMGDFVKAMQRLRERWQEGKCAPALQERLLGIVEDMKEFGHM
ncbi:uncharacterized protein LOC122367025 [Amphibalanus amphitrite]|uniref:uncharacterized protein LOC122366467 n=1 Tax=Amphibalanus amphitrite TaxID=1232801 RepID=UPI001C925A36|nr:uncharacterized protein LOC122366467 [Amphibalanus amphitrite]XP_043195711.1 uncharacterized protein LOC122367025 [Amphibalanus amphitrite]